MLVACAINEKEDDGLRYAREMMLESGMEAVNVGINLIHEVIPGALGIDTCRKSTRSCWMLSVLIFVSS